LKRQISLLVELQRLDSEIRRLSIKKIELPDQLSRQDKEFQTVSQGVDEARKALDVSAKAHRDKESELKDGIDRLRKTKDRLLEVKTNKEYQAMLKEIETIEQKNSGFEDEILTLLEKTDTFKKEIREREKTLDEYRKQYEREKKKTEEELSSLDEEILTCQKNLQGLSSEIERDLAKKYQIIKRRKNGLAVVPVVKGVCTGCHLNIAPQLYNELLKSDQVLSCPFCNRIIYWDEKNSNGA
jgi:predicted  nucleic acid-binding Zn-ribbon protein